MTSQFGSMDLYSDRVVHVLLADGLNLDADIAERGMTAMQEFVGDEPYAVVVDGRKLGYVDLGGRAGLRDNADPNRVATAMIAGSKPTEFMAGRVVAETGFNASAIFTTETEAFAWARQKLAEQR